MLRRVIHTDNDKQTIIIRFLVGCVFLSEGIQKILFAKTLGSGRFETIGLPAPEILGPFVAMVEICGGFLLLIGLCTRLVSVPLIVVILVAIATTKSVIYVEKGFWELLHNSRTDWAMLLGCMFLFIKGSGFYSVDYTYNKIKSYA
jgi:putative oxidoreductase